MSNENNEFNADELKAPTWLDSQFLKNVLANNLKDDQLEVLYYKISPATVKGDHYASVMFRVAVEYMTQAGEKASKSLIIKTMPELEGFKKEQLGESHIFQTEIGMYTEILPKIEAILREASDDISLYAPCLYCSLDPRQVMIFEDLVPLGYTVVRDREPTLEEVKCAYSKLAKWHAVSYKLQKEEPAVFEKYKYSLMELPKIMEDPFMNGIDYFIRMLDEVPDLSVYKPHFEKIRANYQETFRASFVEYRENRQENAYYVLCHGDLYIRNMMFKHNKESGILEDCMLLDFQMSNVGPMPNDIIYSIYQMLSPDQRQYHRNELIEYYFSNFTETLKKIKYAGELPNLAEFHRQLFRQRYLELFLLTTFLPLMYCVKSGKQKSEDMVEMRYKEDLRQSFYRIEGYVEEVRKLLKSFEQQGYFE